MAKKLKKAKSKTRKHASRRRNVSTRMPDVQAQSWRRSPGTGWKPHDVSPWGGW